MRLLAVLLCFLAGPALALSCLRPDVARTFNEVNAAPERWGAVVGRLDFDASRLPEVDWEKQNEVPPETRLRAQLVGHSLGPDGWQKPFQGNVTLVVQCFGPWCARPPSGQRVLAFVRWDNPRHLVFADPCGTKMFFKPTRSDLDRLHRCFLGGACEEDPLLP